MNCLFFLQLPDFNISWCSPFYSPHGFSFPCRFIVRSRFFICGSVLSNLAQDFDDASPRLQGKVDLATVLEDCLDFGMVTLFGG